MRISSDIDCFYRIYSIEETIDILAGAGFDAIDFSFMDKRYHNGEISEEECKKYFTGVRKYAEDKGICFEQCHAPGSPASDEQEEWDYKIECIERAMRNASYLGVNSMVVHPVTYLDYAISGNKEKTFELNMKFFNLLKPYCEKYNIRVGIENVAEFRKTSVIGERFFHTACSTPEELIKYLDELNSKWFVGCLDIGHALVVHQSPAEFARKLGDRLKLLHLHDSDGYRDSHTLPYLGGFGNWEEITTALREIGYSGNINFETGNFLKPLPKELYPNGAALLYAMGQHLANKIKG